MLQLLTLMETVPIDVNEYNHAIQNALCNNLEVEYVHVTVKDGSDFSVPVYVQNQDSSSLKKAPVLQGYVKSIEYDCDSNLNIKGKYEHVPAVVANEGYIVNYGTYMRSFDWMIDV